MYLFTICPLPTLQTTAGAPRGEGRRLFCFLLRPQTGPHLACSKRVTSSVNEEVGARHPQVQILASSLSCSVTGSLSSVSPLCPMCKIDLVIMPAHMGVVKLPEWMQQGANYGAWHIGYTPEMRKRVTATAVITVARKGSACSDSVYSFIHPCPPQTHTDTSAFRC